MRKLILIPALLLFVAASPQKVEQPRSKFRRQYSEPISTRIDSINVKASELNSILRKEL